MSGITKLKNFEGYEHHCHCCGKLIKDAYTVGKDNKVYGSKCVLKISAMPELTKKLMKIADHRMNKFMRDGARLAKELNLPIEIVEAEILAGTLR